MLTSLRNVGKTGVDVTALQAEKGDIMAVLCNENVWICDMGASTHMTWSSKCMRNMHETQTLSLGHTREAVESTAMIDIPGVFT